MQDCSAAKNEVKIKKERFNSLSSPGQGMPGFSGIQGNTGKKKDD